MKYTLDLIHVRKGSNTFKSACFESSQREWYLGLLKWLLWSLYEIIHICTAVVDESEEWSSQ